MQFLQVIAILAQLLDPRPQPEELLRFPPQALAAETAALGKSLYKTLEGHRDFFPYRYWEFNALANNTWHISQAWEKLSYAHSLYEQGYTQTLRDTLDEIRNQIGHEAFYEGRMPIYP